MRRIVTVGSFLLVVACGGLATPDLRTGVVQGRILGASTAGYVYPAGHPELKVALAADGAFRLTLPAGAQSLVVYDGTFQMDPATDAITSFGHADVVDVEVAGADVLDLGDRDAETLPVAGGVLAGVRGESGALTTNPRFRLVGVEPEIAGEDGASVFFAALPPGTYQLDVAVAGFLDGTLSVDVSSGQTVPYDVEVLVDQAAEVKGCAVALSLGAATGCDGDGLACNAGDGRCYPTDPTTCSRACNSDLDCLAGVPCVNNACTPLVDCRTYLAVAGSSCVDDDPCTAALAGGVCFTPDDHTAGFCSAACTIDRQCVGFGAGVVCTSDHCRPALP